MTIKPVADLYLIKYKDGRLYKCTRDAEEAVDAIGFGFEVEEFVSLDNHRAAMLQGANGNSPVVPDGYALVPVEPTTNQWAAGMQAFDSGMDKVTRVYKAMLAAAPQQEVNT